MEHVLVATLGDSPIVVTSMYYLLKEQKKQPVDRVILIYPEGDNRTLGRNIIEDTLAKEGCPVNYYSLAFEDAYDEKSCFAFLSQLFAILKNSQQQGDMVYLSLAGGRKNMSALMALVAPFFQRSLKGLYHIIDKYESTSKTSSIRIQKLEDLYTSDTARCLAAMHPNLDNLILVRIPLENALSVSEEYLQKLSTMTAEQLQKLWEKDPTEAEKQQFHLRYVNPGIIEPSLQVFLTELAKKEFEKLGGGIKENFAKCFRGMRSPKHLAKAWHLDARKSYTGHFYKEEGTIERPFFHTEPGDIINYPHSTVERVIVERMAKHRSRDVYEPTKESFEQTTYNKGGKLYPLEEILNEKQPTPSILIVPMGTAPMVATQLHTLLTTREKHQIQEVILLRTENESVRQASFIARDAFEDKGIICTMKSILGLEDIASDRDCEIYQNVLEQVIVGLQQRIQQQHSNWRIDLALSGGRKGMAALALFAAQRTQLSEVYHTLIKDETLSRRIEAETSIDVLQNTSQEKINARLFLEAYQEYETSFQLFKVPMGPLHGK